MKHFLWAGVLLAAGLAACGGNSAPSGTPTPGPTCEPPAGTSYQLIYPAPNATSVPDTFGEIVVATSPAPLPSGSPNHAWNAELIDAQIVATYGGAVGGGVFAAAPTPLPSPAATPSFSGAIYQSSSFSGLSPQVTQTVQVYLNDTSSNCYPLGPIGSFSTQ